MLLDFCGPCAFGGVGLITERTCREPREMMRAMGNQRLSLRHPLQRAVVALVCCACSSGTPDSSLPPFGGGEASAPAPSAMDSAAGNTNTANAAPSPSSTPTTTSEPTASPDLTLTMPASN